MEGGAQKVCRVFRKRKREPEEPEEDVALKQAVKRVPMSKMGMIKTDKKAKPKEEAAASESYIPGIGEIGFTEENEESAGGAGGGAAVVKKQTAGKKRFGPKPAPENVRQITVVDRQPGICKDYYETGFCSFGDACKFAHFREDYKSGAQLEKEEMDEMKRRKEKAMMKQLHGTSDTESEEEDDGLPTCCPICSEGFTDPVVTKCGHYFCEVCAIDFFKGSGRCAECDKPTLGVFNTAKRLMTKLKEKEKRKQEKKDKELD